MGRVVNHEIGHWLGLRHIWGDAMCGNDFVDDTPTKYTASRGCPDTITTCGYFDNVNNYMDYVDTRCMLMFTEGQKLRAYGHLLLFRSELLNQDCFALPVEEGRPVKLKIYPNPTSSEINIDGYVNGMSTIEVYNIYGKLIKSINVSINGRYTMNLTDLRSGNYIMKIINNNEVIATKRLILSKMIFGSNVSKSSGILIKLTE